MILRSSSSPQHASVPWYPGKTQFIAESGYLFARNSLDKETLGVPSTTRPFRLRFCSPPFFFALVNNLTARFRSSSYPPSPTPVAPTRWLAWHTRPGSAWASSARAWAASSRTSPCLRASRSRIYPILIPIEFFSNMLIRPATHALRLFRHHVRWSPGAMVALQHGDPTWLRLWRCSGYLAAIAPGALGLFLYFLEFMIQCIQAYVFALLLAVVPAGSRFSEGH